MAVTPTAFDPHPACLGLHHLGGQCDDCAVRVLPSDYKGSFPDVALIAPDLVQRRIDGEFTELTLICRNRRAPGKHRPAAVCGAGGCAVGALGHCDHGRTVTVPDDQGKPLCIGGAS